MEMIYADMPIAEAVDGPPPLNIEVFGKYYLIDRIAVGGMGEIFRAKSFGVGGFENLVAIKRIVAPPTLDERFVRMFMNEARIFAVLQAANIVRMYDFGKISGTYFIAMECVDGKDVKCTIQKLMGRGQQLPVQLALYIAMEAAKGLHYAHNRTAISGEALNIVHRDVTPSNVLLSYAGEVKVGDFGIVRAVSSAENTDVGAITGKVGYMSPEQALGTPLDRRSDIFGLGVLLHEMLTGRRLFKAQSDLETLDRVRSADVPPPSTLNPEVPQRLDAIVMRALSKHPDDRYQTARDLQSDLLDFIHPMTSEELQQTLSQFMHALFADEMVAERERAVRGSQLAREMYERQLAVDSEPSVVARQTAQRDALERSTAQREAAPREFGQRPTSPLPVTPDVDEAEDTPGSVLGGQVGQAIGLTVIPRAQLGRDLVGMEAPVRRPNFFRTWWNSFFSPGKVKAPAEPRPVAAPRRDPPPREAAPRESAAATATKAGRGLFVESPAPWHGAEAIQDPHPGNVRMRLTERLHVLREQAPSRNDWMFIDRLVRACSSPGLDFPLFPTGVRRLDWLLRAGEIDQTQVVEVVLREPGMLKRVWEEAQSAAFGGSVPSNVREAVTRLGHRRLWEIGMSACMNSKVFQARAHQARADHLRDVSMVAADISGLFDPSGDAYLPSLLHGLGKLVVYRCGPARKPEESASPEYVAEVADLVYPSVGMLLADAWSIGPSAAAGIGFAPSPGRAPAELRKVALATRAATMAAHEAWALRESRTYDGFAEMTALGISGLSVSRALDAAEVAWRKSKQAPK